MFGAAQHVSVKVPPRSQHGTPDGQHWVPHGVVPLMHSQVQVSVFGNRAPLQDRQRPFAHSTVPAGHAHSDVDGSQKLLQHSLFWRHLYPPFLHRPTAPAPPAPKSAKAPPAPAVANSFSACRRDVVCASVLLSWSNCVSPITPPSSQLCLLLRRLPWATPFSPARSGRPRGSRPHRARRPVRSRPPRR